MELSLQFANPNCPGGHGGIAASAAISNVDHFVQPLSFRQSSSSLLMRTKASQSTSARLELNTSVMNVDNGQCHDRDAAVPPVPSGG